MLIVGPCKPDMTGTVTTFMNRCRLTAEVDSASQHPRSIIQVKKPPKGGTAGHPTGLGFPLNHVITLRDGMRIFTVLRPRSVLLRPGAVLPDPAGPQDALGVASKSTIPTTLPTHPSRHRSALPARLRDFFARLNVLSIVVELPRAKLGHGKIGVWATTSVTTDGVNADTTGPPGATRRQ